MKREGWLFLISVLLLVMPASARTPAWSGIIDPSRAIDWSSTGVGATIVNRTKQCGSAIAAYRGSAASINSALASCNNGYVLLGPGTFTLSTGINFGARNNVTLRGSGPTETIINFAGGDKCGGLGGDICAINSTRIWYGGPQVQYGAGCGGQGGAANWTGGYAQESTQITLSCTTGLSVGMTIFLDQQDDASDTGGVYVCQTEGPCATTTPAGEGRPGRGQLEMKQIVAINGNVVTISPGLYNTNWRAAQNPGAWWVGPMLTGVGIENLTANDNDSGTTVQAGIYFFNCHDCWVKNVKSVDPNRNHVWCWQSSNITVRDSYFYGTQNGANESYGIEGYMCADALIENNIVEHLPAPYIFNSTTGSVISYNFDIDHVYTSATYQIAGHLEHGPGTAFNLWEGNQTVQFVADDIHGTHNQETLFRNWINGKDVDGQTQETVPIILFTHNRGYNLVGNVLGTPRYHTNYEDRYDQGRTANGDHTVYVLGYCGNAENMSTTSCTALNGVTFPNDALTPTTLFRWGNYDTATGTVRWVSNEVPTSAVPYVNGNPLPASRTLPASFYLTSKPAWWGSVPWPATGPDVTGGTGPGGHAYAIPAAVCYHKTSKDSTGTLLFDANVCYHHSGVSLRSF